MRPMRIEAFAVVVGAQQLMPKVRNWMNTHSWQVNIIVYVIFILLILS